jgi:hypothetical protein
VLGRGRFEDLVRRQLDLFEADEASLLHEAEEADAAWTRAPREETEERFGDYQLVVDEIAERLLDIRETYVSSLDERTGDDYRAAFNRAAVKRFRPYTALLLEARE